MSSCRGLNGYTDVAWEKNIFLSTGENSGIVPLLDAQPMYIVDHGSKDYAHDAFGIHIGQEDHLTFLGSSDKIIKLDLVDCRKGSKTLHQKDSIEFSPDPRRCLIIPNGVAHCFSGLENVYTINRPAVCVDNWQAYDSANDVIDWPITNTTYPVLDVTNKYVPQEFYNKQTVVQRGVLTEPTKSTPIVLIARDTETGQDKRISMVKNG